MSLDERRVLLAEIKPILGDTLWEEISGTRAAKSGAEPETVEEAVKIGAAFAKSRRKGGRGRPFWLKEVIRVDAKGRGMDAIEGEWISEMDSMENSSRHVLLGTRSAPKTYVILTFDKGKTAIVNGTYEIENAKIVSGPFTSFKDVVSALASVIISGVVSWS
tara:strand:+ start:2313 stop:2798 length:486 start_codon:yes stop_codon:yes gene_type:complete